MAVASKEPETVPARQRPSSHWDERRGGARPAYIILHYTDTLTLAEAEDLFFGRRPHPDGADKRVSAHYAIDYNGTVIQYVDEEMRAWHAGVSYWDGADDLNSRSIGIELVNPGRNHGYRAFPAPQMEALIRLCRGIMTRHGIAPHRVLAHSDVAPERKQDPGELFDWKMLADAGIAVWPRPEKQDYEAAGDYVNDERNLREAFMLIGYNPEAGLKSLVTAFQRHFYPEVFRGQDHDRVGTADREMAARLHWLVRNRPNL